MPSKCLCCLFTTKLRARPHLFRAWTIASWRSRVAWIVALPGNISHTSSSNSVRSGKTWGSGCEASKAFQRRVDLVSHQVIRVAVHGISQCCYDGVPLLRHGSPPPRELHQSSLTTGKSPTPVLLRLGLSPPSSRVVEQGRAQHRL